MDLNFQARIDSLLHFPEKKKLRREGVENCLLLLQLYGSDSLMHTDVVMYFQIDLQNGLFQNVEAFAGEDKGRPWKLSSFLRKKKSTSQGRDHRCREAFSAPKCICTALLL